MTVGLPVYRVTNADLVVPSDVLGNDTPNLQTLNIYDDSIAALQAAGYPSVQVFTTTAAASMTFAFSMSMLLAGVSGGSNPFGPLVWPGGWVKALIKNDASQTMSSSSIGFNDTVALTWTLLPNPYTPRRVASLHRANTSHRATARARAAAINRLLAWSSP